VKDFTRNQLEGKVKEGPEEVKKELDPA